MCEISGDVCVIASYVADVIYSEGKMRSVSTRITLRVADHIWK